MLMQYGGIFVSEEKKRVEHSVEKSKDLYIQVLRGFAIMAVVLIHCLSQEDRWVLAVRPFLNFGVALFIFLSGYLTPRSKCEHVSAFYKHRLGKILLPYVIWSLVYLAIAGDVSIKSVVVGLCVGNAAAQMYFLLVYAQLVLLTPLLYRWLAMRFGWLLWTVTPLILLAREILARGGISVPRIMAFCGSWLIFYLFGMQWKVIVKRLSGWVVPLLVLCIMLALQMGAGFFWYERYGNWDLATSQLKLTSMLFALAMIVVLMQVPQRLKTGLSHLRMLTMAGDCSFGVYLCHLMILTLVNRLLIRAGYDATTFGLVMFRWLVVLVCSIVIVRICQLTLPKSVQLCIGCE